MTAPLYGYLASFEQPEDLLHAAREARQRGHRRMQAYSPFPVEGLAEAVGFRFNWLPWLVLGGGLAGGGGATSCSTTPARSATGLTWVGVR